MMTKETLDSILECAGDDSYIFFKTPNGEIVEVKSVTLEQSSLEGCFIITLNG